MAEILTDHLGLSPKDAFLELLEDLESVTQRMYDNGKYATNLQQEQFETVDPKKGDKLGLSRQLDRDSKQLESSYKLRIELIAGLRDTCL